jgi:hypothetical protein
MKVALTTLILALVTLSGCAVVPVGYRGDGYRGDGYRDGYSRSDGYRNGYNRGDGYRDGYYRGDGYRGYAAGNPDHGQ